MKKFLFTLISVIAFCANAMADGVCATLQHGETMKAYYGADAFKSAYADAAKGDVITLSEGQFNVVSSVAKSVKIIGAYGFTNDATVSTLVASMGIDADSVHVEGIYFSGNVTLGSIKDCIIRRCYMANKLEAKESSTNTNTIVDQCVVMYDYAIGSSVNYTIKNSTIKSFKEIGSSTNKANILNNVVYYWAGNSKPYGIYKNNVLGIPKSSCSEDKKYNSWSGDYDYTYSYTVSGMGDFYYNLLFLSDSPSTTYATFTFSVTFSSSTPNKGNDSSLTDKVFGSKNSEGFTYPVISRTTYGYGQDGTAKGPYGGTGFTKNPAIPRITSSTIDPRTDAEGKLNVKITVTAQ